MLTESKPHSGLNFDHWQFEGTRQRIASAHTGLDYRDIGNVQVIHHGQSSQRRTETPAWSLNDKLLQNLLVAYMEFRLGITDPCGSLQERRAMLEHAWYRLRPVLDARLDRLNKRYVEAVRRGDTKRAKQLEIQVEALDTYIRVSNVGGGLGTMANVVYCYYRRMLDSVGTADECGVKPPSVRQTLYRLNQFFKSHCDAEGNSTLLRPARPRVIRVGPTATVSWASVHQMHAEGLAYSVIAERLGTTVTAVWKYLMTPRTHSAHRRQ